MNKPRLILLLLFLAALCGCNEGKNLIGQADFGAASTATA